MKGYREGFMEKGKQTKQKSRMGFVSLLVVGVAILAIVTSAQAAASLQLSDGKKHTLTLTETAGVISYSGSLGKLSLNITTNPAVGDALLRSMNFSLSGKGTLTLMLSNSSIATLPGQLSATINGQTGGSVVFSTAGSSSNSMFAMNSQFTSNSFAKGSFNKTSLSPVSLTGPFSLTEKIVVTSSKKGGTSFSTNVVDPPLAGGNIATVPDTGSTLLLLTLAVSGLCLAHRRLAAQ